MLGIFMTDFIWLHCILPTLAAQHAFSPPGPSFQTTQQGQDVRWAISDRPRWQCKGGERQEVSPACCQDPAVSEQMTKGGASTHHEPYDPALRACATTLQPVPRYHDLLCDQLADACLDW